ncbi:hypothetical protein DPEC_G00344990 [Dallia pectoralis]|uniref:Uncharacterized protein n=1 Tax=Dallia pectoralis TaxID=75939 RepID=A0ACC2F3D5_DALPE|nr:hypothetical protein DPEC_G00344990 [Dallia pectoralis]
MRSSAASPPRLSPAPLTSEWVYGVSSEGHPGSDIIMYDKRQLHTLYLRRESPPHLLRTLSSRHTLSVNGSGLCAPGGGLWRIHTNLGSLLDVCAARHGPLAGKPAAEKGGQLALTLCRD